MGDGAVGVDKCCIRTTFTACTIVVVLATWFPGGDAQSGVGELVDNFVHKTFVFE